MNISTLPMQFLLIRSKKSRVEKLGDLKLMLKGDEAINLDY